MKLNFAIIVEYIVNKFKYPGTISFVHNSTYDLISKMNKLDYLLGWQPLSLNLPNFAWIIINLQQNTPKFLSSRKSSDRIWQRHNKGIRMFNDDIFNYIFQKFKQFTRVTKTCASYRKTSWWHRRNRGRDKRSCQRTGGVVSTVEAARVETSELSAQKWDRYFRAGLMLTWRNWI